MSFGREIGSAAPTPPAANSRSNLYNRAKKSHTRTCIDILPQLNPKILKLYEEGDKFANAISTARGDQDTQ